MQHNGTQFVIQAYREWVKNKKKSPLIERIRAIAEQQGQFVRLYKRRSGEYEAVFSSSPGYLLGESIKHYFQHVKNLIFCEATNDHHQVLLVVIKDGHVFSDTLVSLDQLKTELLPLTTLKMKFQIVVSGKAGTTVLSKKDPDFFFPENLTISYEHIEEPLVSRLPALPIVKLLPLPLALKSEHLSTHSLLATSIVIITALILLIGLFTYSTHTQKPLPHKPKKLAPYTDYVTALQSPSPKRLLNTLSGLITTLFQIPGWRAHSITQNHNEYVITLQSDGGTLALMQQWATHHHFHVVLTENGVELHKRLSFPNRRAITHLFSLQELCENLMDAIQQKTFETRIQLKQTIQHHETQESLLAIHLTDVSPQQLQTLMFIFNRLPIVIHQIQMNIGDDSLIQGVIQLSVWGK
ncbi:MAG: hypothetical protein A3F17_03395 [Gammaproteobacteria bacterium RIFCSPHIGHO2_12_FULL_41_15]|nr:MAG: hypothetical protein A3F17_03395 [Gammaproteobacteria bacterium RIFCSPHIGHO2_12_FULL_41_15]